MKIRSEYKYIIFKITDDKKFIEIEAKGEKTEDFKSFCSKLPDADCRYAVLDVEINTKSGATTNKLIFVAWYTRLATMRALRRGRTDRASEGEGGGSPKSQDSHRAGSARRPVMPPRLLPRIDRSTLLHPPLQVGR